MDKVLTIVFVNVGNAKKRSLFSLLKIFNLVYQTF